MDTPLLPDAFYLDLDEVPDDATTLCALADWHEERGDDSTAACVRWAMRRGIHPYRFARAEDHGALRVGPTWKEGWYWWVIDEPNAVEVGSCRLPPALWDRLHHSFPYTPSIMKEYPTRRAAYEALFEAWPVYAPRARSARDREGAR